MSGYDSWKTTCPEDDGPAPQACPVCTGDRDAPPCSEECDALLLRARCLGLVRGGYESIRRCLMFARLYRNEGGARDLRYRNVLDQIGAYRRFIAAARKIGRGETHPALADTLPAPAEVEEAAQ